MKTVGSGAVEIRIHREGEWRVIHVAKFGKAIYVLHAFEKRMRKTRQANISLAQQRYKEVEAHEKAKQKGSGNVFLDLVFEPAEAAVLEMRATLMSDLRAHIEKEQLTQAEAAKRLGIVQSRVSQ